MPLPTKKRSPSKMHRFKPIPLTLHTLANRTVPLACLLTTRSVIRFSGPETIKFLQGLLTNDVRKLGEPNASLPPTPNLPPVSFPPIYAALLTPLGRFLYDLFLYRPNGSDQAPDAPSSGVELYADVDSDVVDELLLNLRRYRLRSKVEIDNVAKDFSCWQQFGGSLDEESRDVEEPEASHGNEFGWQWFKDPRLDCLGFRGIFPSDKTPPLVEADKEMDEKNYLLWRVQNGVAEGSTEIPKGEAVPLEYNFAGLNAISFDKGCYVGQELIARTHHRGVIRKRLLPLKFLNDSGKEVDQKVAPGSEVIDCASGKKVGSVTTVVGCHGLGLLRLEEAFRGSGSLVIQGQEDVKVEATRPTWWPAEWFPEHQQHCAVA